MGLGVTQFGYVGMLPGETLGGQVVLLAAKVALALNEVAMIDTATDDQVDKATSGSALVCGVCIGTAGKSGEQIDLTKGPAIGEKAVIQVSGIVQVIADGVISRGDRISVAATAGRVKTATALAVSIDAGATSVTSTAANGAITTATGEGADLRKTFGRALQAAASAGDKIRMLLS